MNKNQINILIIDDEASSRDSLSETVRRAGYKVTVVDKAENALNSVRIKPIHAAIIDCMLPKKNGVLLAQDLRKSRFGNAPIVFVSGIFKDKAFAQDAMIKTGAVDFFTKPIPLNALVESLDKELASLIDAPKIPLHALLSKPYASDRDRVKALESIEEVTGFDLPLIISILLDSSSSGHLNVLTKEGDISGITFHKGKVIKVDTAEGGKLVGNLLIRAGLLTNVDIEELPEKKRQGDIVKNLIAENLISPHASDVVKAEQIYHDLEKMLKEKDLQINFVPERMRESVQGVTSVMLTSFYHKVLGKYYSLDWLRQFYRDWLDHPMRTGPEISSASEVMELVTQEMGMEFMDTLKQEPTIQEILQDGKRDELQLFRVIHLLALRRVIVFDDAKRATNMADQHERLKTILRDIEGKTPFEIFDYFGAGKNPSIREAERVYKEFARANHPDTLSTSASKELKELVHKVYALVSEAYDILSNEGKREKFIISVKQKDAEKQMNSERLGEEGLVLLRRGQIKEALLKLNEATKLYPSNLLNIYWSWATVKARGDKISASTLKAAQMKMDLVPIEERRTPIYLFVSGLIKKAGGDTEGALAQIDKALSIDPNFLDARRELSMLRQPKEGNTETFTGELTSIVGRLFKKPAKR